MDNIVWVLLVFRVVRSCLNFISDLFEKCFFEKILFVFSQGIVGYFQKETGKRFQKQTQRNRLCVNKNQ